LSFILSGLHASILTDIPQDSAQDGKEHLDQDTDNRENSGEVIQESHYNEPENLQKASEEIVE